MSVSELELKIIWRNLLIVNHRNEIPDSLRNEWSGIYSNYMKIKILEKQARQIQKKRKSTQFNCNDLD